VAQTKRDLSTVSEVRQAPDHSVIVGRQAELRELAAGLDRAFAGRGGIVFLKGEPGIGKTSLAEKVAADAATRGAAVHWGRSTQAEGAPPYWPWRQILRSLLRELEREEFARLAGAAISDIAQIAPEVRDMFTDLVAEAGDEAGRFRAYDGVAQLLVEASRHRPTLVVLEDLHWADAPSLILLQHLAGVVARSQLLVVGTYRDRELSPDHVLRARLGDFVRAGDVVEMPLSGLGSTDVVALLRMLTSFDPAPDVVRRLQEQTAGNPFFLKEVARALAGDDRPHPRARLDEPANVPEGVAAVLLRRISSLSASMREVLAVAAVAGHQLDLSLIAAATDLPRAALLDACDEATKAGVLVRDAGGYEFAHGLYRDTVYAEIPAARRAGLHGEVADALERRPPRGEAPATQLAHHFAQAALGDDALRQKAFTYSVRAGEQAASDLAYEEAVRHLERALGFTGEIAPARRAELLLSLGRARYHAGDPGAALSAAGEASRIGEQLGDGDLLARAALVVRGVGGPGITPLVKSLCDSAVRHPSVDPSLRIQVLSQLTVTLMQMVEPDAALRAQDVSVQAMRLAREATDPDIVFAAIHARQMARSSPDGVEERLELGDRALVLGRETGRAVFADWGHGWRADALAQLGRMDEAEVEIAEQGRAAAVLREPLARWRHLLARSWIALLRGDFDAARNFADEAHALGTGSSHPIAEFHHLVHALAVEELTGYVEDNRGARMERFARQHPEMAPPFLVFRATELASEGRRAEAQTMLRPLMGFKLENIRPVMTLLAALAYAAKAAVAINDTAMASDVYVSMVPYAGQNVVTCAGLASLFGSVAHYLGRLAGTQGRLEDASRHYESAIALETAMGAPPFVARTQVFYAELLLERGDAAALRKARPLAEEALATSKELNMRPWIARAGAVLVAVAGRGIEDHPLSRRELEVATLVSEGLSNNAIAGRLHLSGIRSRRRALKVHQQLGQYVDCLMHQTSHRRAVDKRIDVVVILFREF